MNLTILGAGAWGTALAVVASARHATQLWARDADQAARMTLLRRNERYLDEIALPASLQITPDFDAAVAHARGGLLIIATPMAALAEMLQRVPADASGVLWLCKGFQEGTGWLGHVAEGVYTAAMVQRRAVASGVEMPITDAVVDVLEGSITPVQAVEQLMGRESRPEH